MSALVLGQMFHDGGDHMGRGWWFMMGIGWLVFLGLLVALSVVLVRHFTRSGPARGAAEDVLAERFARGEIDEEEYRRGRDTLRG